MKLNKRYARSIKNNASFYICISLLTVLAIALYLLFSGGVTGEERYYEKFKRECNLEDGQFTLYHDMSSSDIENMEDEFDVEIEKMVYADMEEDGYTIRVMQKNDKINLYSIVEGKDISLDSDIILTAKFMDKRNKKIGDTISMNGKEYTICGKFERPDYLFPIQSVNDTYPLWDSFVLGIVSENEFSLISENSLASYYSVVYHKENETEFRQALYDKYYTASYTAANNNPRIQNLQDNIQSMTTMSQVIMPLMVVFIILLMAVILGRKISNERKIIGVLSALGYKKRELALHYSMFGVIPGLIGSILGIVISVNTIDLFVPALFEETEPLPADYSIQISWILIALLVPTISYFLATYITALRAMRADTIEMLKGNGKDTGKQKMKMEHSKLNFKTKFKIRQIFGNFSRTVLVIVSVSIAGFLLVFCYSCIDSMDVYVANTVKEIGTVEYEYFLNTIQTEEPKQGKAVISAYFEGTKNNETVVLMGTGDNGYVNTDLEDGTGKADLNSDDFYITSMAARVFGVEKGDKFKFRDVASMKEYQISIAGVVQNDSQAIIYTSRERACSLLELPKEYYNLVMSDKAIDYTDADLASTVTKKALGDQIKTVADQMRDMLGMIFVFAMLICVIVVYLMVNMLLTENTTSISMLKVLGYKEKEINKMVIHIYHWLLPIGILMGLLLGMAFTKVNFQESVAQYKTYIETSISVSSVIKFVIVILISYIVSILLLSRKVGKVNMVESLKDNRE